MAYGAIDAIGGAISPKVVKSLRKSGKYILYGALDTSPVSASNGDILAQTKVLHTIFAGQSPHGKVYQCSVLGILCCGTCFAIHWRKEVCSTFHT